MPARAALGGTVGTGAAGSAGVVGAGGEGGEGASADGAGGGDAGPTAALGGSMPDSNGVAGSSKATRAISRRGVFILMARMPVRRARRQVRRGGETAERIPAVPWATERSRWRVKGWIGQGDVMMS